MGQVLGVNREPQLVRLMEAHHGEAMQALDKFVKGYIIRMPIFTMMPALLCMVRDWKMSISLSVITAVFYLMCFRHIKKNASLGKVGIVLFGTQQLGQIPNLEDVYNTTLKICEIKGCISSTSHVLDIYNICSSSFVVINLLISIIGGN